MNMLAPRLDFTPLTDHQEKLQLNGNVNIDVIGWVGKKLYIMNKLYQP